MFLYWWIHRNQLWNRSIFYICLLFLYNSVVNILYLFFCFSTTLWWIFYTNYLFLYNSVVNILYLFIVSLQLCGEYFTSIICLYMTLWSIFLSIIFFYMTLWWIFYINYLFLYDPVVNILHLLFVSIWLCGAMQAGIIPLIGRSQVCVPPESWTLHTLSWLYTDWFGFQYRSHIPGGPSPGTLKTPHLWKK